MMKTETIIHQHPPTPPDLNVDLHPGFHHLAQYNADHVYCYDEPGGYGAGYSYSPSGSTAHDQLLQHPAHPRQAGDEFGLGIKYEEVNHGLRYYQNGHGNGYPSNHTIFSASPPTPRSGTEADEAGRRTRSGRALGGSSSPREPGTLRPKMMPKSRKSKAEKGEKHKTPKLTAPLSELTKGLSSIPVRNMKEWVERSTETRLKEVEKRNGYVTRPMNSFMLYRSAYAERTKQWCLQNNHQVVSSVSGESWPLEPPEIRDLYNEYAKVERLNHQAAHPTYKFSPSKTTVPPRRRKGDSSDVERSDVEEDSEWTPGQRQKRYRPPKQPEQNLSYLPNGMESGFFDPSLRPDGNGRNKAGWEMSHEGRPVAMPMAHDDPYNQYYQTSMHTPGTMEDMRFPRVDSPSLTIQFAPDHALLGLPGGHAVGLMQQMNSHVVTPLGAEPQVDPMLLAFDSIHHVGGAASAQQPEIRNGHMAMTGRGFNQHNDDRLIDRAPQEEEYRPDPWQTDLDMGPIELESEFDKWGLVGDHQT